MIVGGNGGVTVELVALVAVPPGVVTAMGPLAAPLGTVAVICASEFTVNVAAVPLNVTAVAPVKLVPVMVTEVPGGPLVGLNELIVGGGGGGSIVKVSVAVPVPVLLVALSVTVEVPAAVGVPEIKPVAVFTDNPAGNPVALKLVGLLVAVI